MGSSNSGTHPLWDRDWGGGDIAATPGLASVGPSAVSPTFSFATSPALTHAATDLATSITAPSITATSGLFTHGGPFSPVSAFDGFEAAGTSASHALAGSTAASALPTAYAGGGFSTLYSAGALGGGRLGSSSSATPGMGTSTSFDVSSSTDEVTFISGVDANHNVVAVGLNSWNGNDPATFTSDHTQTKFGSHTTGTGGGTVYYYFDPGSSWSTTEKNGLASGLALWSAVANISFVETTTASQAGIDFTRGSDGGAATN